MCTYVQLVLLWPHEPGAAPEEGAGEPEFGPVEPGGPVQVVGDRGGIQRTEAPGAEGPDGGHQVPFSAR